RPTTGRAARDVGGRPFDDHNGIAAGTPGGDNGSRGELSAATTARRLTVTRVPRRSVLAGARGQPALFERASSELRPVHAVVAVEKPPNGPLDRLHSNAEGGPDLLVRGAFDEEAEQLQLAVRGGLGCGARAFKHPAGKAGVTV